MDELLMSVAHELRSAGFVTRVLDGVGAMANSRFMGPSCHD